LAGFISTLQTYTAQDLIANTTTHDMTSDADYNLTSTENLKGRVIITDTGVVLTTGRNIVVANTARFFLVLNSTAQTLTFKTAAGTGIAVLAGEIALLYCDGTNVIESGVASQDYITRIITGASGVPRIQYEAFETDIKPFRLIETLSGTSGTSFQTTDSILSGYTECYLVIEATQTSGAGDDFQIQGKSGASVISAANYDSYGDDYTAFAAFTAQTYFDPRINVLGATTTSGIRAELEVRFKYLGDGATNYPTALFNYAPKNNAQAAGSDTRGKFVYQALTAFDGFYFFWNGGSTFTYFNCEVWAR